MCDLPLNLFIYFILPSSLGTVPTMIVSFFIATTRFVVVPQRAVSSFVVVYISHHSRWCMDANEPASGIAINRTATRVPSMMLLLLLSRSVIVQNPMAALVSVSLLLVLLSSVLYYRRPVVQKSSFSKRFASRT